VELKTLADYVPVACVAWEAMTLLASPGLSSANTHRVAGLLADNFDLERLRSLLVYHRVVPAAAANLSGELETLVPKAFSSWLQGRRDVLSGQVVRQFQMHSLIRAALGGAGVPHRFFKGLTLSTLLHSELALRQAKDIDVMIPRSQLPVADACLRKLGYSSLLDDDKASLMGNRLAITLGKDVVYRAPGKPEVELHWRVHNANTRFSAYYSRVLFRLSSKSVTPDEFVYLCWHAGKTLHHRFKWLVDIDCYLRKGEESHSDFLDQVIHIAYEHCVDRYVYLALYLLQRSFPWHAHRGFVQQAPNGVVVVGRRIERRWLSDQEMGAGKLSLMWDRFYLASSWRDRLVMANSLLWLPTDDVREMLNRRSGLSAGLARALVPLLLVKGYWQR